jgi:membrane-bound lytic murein transglycosylase MltF
VRKEAKKRGLDPNVWFNSVETVTAEKIGIETTTYVRNIFKSYVSYKLTTEAHETDRASHSIADVHRYLSAGCRL